MAFKALVQAINQSFRERDNVLTLNSIHSLQRDIRNDVIDAFVRAGPLIQQHKELYRESNSFLDFLFKLCQIQPLEPTDDRTHLQQLNEALKQRDELKLQLDDAKNELKRCRDSLETHSKFADYKRELQETKNQLKNMMERVENNQSTRKDPTDTCSKCFGYKFERNYFQRQLEDANMKLKECNESLEKEQTLLKTCYQCTENDRLICDLRHSLDEANRKFNEPNFCKEDATACSKCHEYERDRNDTNSELEECRKELENCRQSLERDVKGWKDAKCPSCDDLQKQLDEANRKLKKCEEKRDRDKKMLEDAKRLPEYMKLAIDFQKQLQIAEEELNKYKKAMDEETMCSKCSKYKNQALDWEHKFIAANDKLAILTLDQQTRIYNDAKNACAQCSTLQRQVEDLKIRVANASNVQDTCDGCIGYQKQLEKLKNKFDNQSENDMDVNDACSTCLEYLAELEELKHQFSAVNNELTQYKNKQDNDIKFLKTVCSDCTMCMQERDEARIQLEKERNTWKSVTENLQYQVDRKHDELQKLREDAKLCRACFKCQTQIEDANDEDVKCCINCNQYREQFDESQRRLEDANNELQKCRRELNEDRKGVNACSSCAGYAQDLNELRGKLELSEIYEKKLLNTLKKRSNKEQQIKKKLKSKIVDDSNTKLEGSLQNGAEDSKDNRVFSNQPKENDFTTEQLLNDKINEIKNRMISFFPKSINLKNWDYDFFEKVSDLKTHSENVDNVIRRELSNLASELGITVQVELDTLSKQIREHFDKVYGAPPLTWSQICKLLNKTDPEEIIKHLKVLIETNEASRSIRESCQENANTTMEFYKSTLESERLNWTNERGAFVSEINQLREDLNFANAKLQSVSALEIELLNLESEKKQLHQNINDLSTKLQSVAYTFEKERSEWSSEKQKLLSDKSKLETDVRRRLEDEPQSSNQKDESLTNKRVKRELSIETDKNKETLVCPESPQKTTENVDSTINLRKRNRKKKFSNKENDSDDDTFHYSHLKYPRVKQDRDNLLKCVAELENCKKQLVSNAEGSQSHSISLNILKNLFQKLYEYHFKMVWNQRLGILKQTEESLTLDMKTKFDMINSLLEKQRGNGILSVLLSYIAYDLNIENQNIYAELYQRTVEYTTAETFLKECMAKTMSEIEALNFGTVTMET